ncbi:hypothetical protein [Nocardioides caricicola]|uniref:SHOCT domain-containing protein n=1 Tax=Nocardioides caricicola TaxID=634770 RepID=A0ABW0N4H3_9ACTN
MERVATSRAHLLGVLRRRPVVDVTADQFMPEVDVRRSNQVRELLTLVDRGLLSEEEFEQQQRRLHRDTP